MPVKKWNGYGFDWIDEEKMTADDIAVRLEHTVVAGDGRIGVMDHSGRVEFVTKNSRI